jgi:transcriptional regulator with GAF, ATPase, and Fis domain
MTTVVDSAHEELLRRLEAFHDLLPTLSGALDVRDVFTQLSTIAARVIPHDEANLALFVPGEPGEHGERSEERVRLLASTSPNADPALITRGCHCFLDDPEIPRVCGDLPPNASGLRSGVRAPVRLGRELVGVIALLSRTPRFYSSSDLPLVERIADYVAISVSHQRLADEARHAAVDRERAAALETSEELLRAVSSVLDIRQVFPRISEIANKVLPHDRLTMSFHDREGNMVIEAASNEDVPAFRLKIDKSGRTDRSAKSAEQLADGGFIIINDFVKQKEHEVTDPPDLMERVVAAGYRSILVVHLFAREQGLGLQFWSKQTNAFTERDVPIARRIADHVALAVSHEQLAEAARQAAEARARADRLEARVKSLSEELDSKAGYGRVVGQSVPWGAALKQATQVAATDTTVLLTGESGTGKEVVARFVHRASARRTGPFVALNCAALPEQLLESELFGYERGAFTGAQQPKPGQIEMAAGGTLFLDEVAEMSPSAQAKFLRVLQEREFQRLGGTRVLKANVRVIAATNRDLRKAMERGDFREDLYYRLRVFDIRLPALRDRPEDILPLSEAFLEEIGKSFGRPPAGMTRDAQEVLLRHRWPGNVRELRNALERAAILCEGGLIAADHFSFPLDEPQLSTSSAASDSPSNGTSHGAPHDAQNGHNGHANGAAHNGAAHNGTTDLNIVEREMIAQVMRESGGNKSKAATKLGLTRSQLYVRLRRYSLE